MSNLAKHLAEWKSESDGWKIIESEEGFALWKDNPIGNSMDIETVFVSKEFRLSGAFHKLVDLVVAEATRNGRTKVLSGVFIPHQNSTQSMKQWLNYGFKMYGAQTNFIYMELEI